MNIAEKIIGELSKTQYELNIRKDGEVVMIYDTPETKLMWTGMEAAAWQSWLKCYETSTYYPDPIPEETIEKIIKPAFESWWNMEL